jgi:hypothetical protein
MPHIFLVVVVVAVVVLTAFCMCVCVFFCVCVLFFVFNFFILRSVFLIPEVQTWSLIRVQLPLEQSDQWLQAGTNDYSLSDEEDQCDQSMRHFRRMVSKPTRATEEKQSRASVRVVGVAKGDTLCCVVGGWWLVVVCKL